MTALSKFLVLLAIFLLAGYANAFLSLSQVDGNQIQMNYLIWFEESNNQNRKLNQEPTNDQTTNEVQPLSTSNTSETLNPTINQIVRESILRLVLTWNHPTIQQEWTIEWRSVTSRMMRPTGRVLLSVILDQKEVQHILAWFSFLLSMLSVRDWNVEFTLIGSLQKIIQSKLEAMHPLNLVGYDTIKTQSK